MISTWPCQWKIEWEKWTNLRKTHKLYSLVSWSSSENLKTISHFSKRLRFINPVWKKIINNLNFAVEFLKSYKFRFSIDCNSTKMRSKQKGNHQFTQLVVIVNIYWIFQDSIIDLSKRSAQFVYIFKLQVDTRTFYSFNCDQLQNLSCNVDAHIARSVLWVALIILEISVTWCWRWKTLKLNRIASLNQ